MVWVDSFTGLAWGGGGMKPAGRTRSLLGVGLAGSMEAAPGCGVFRVGHLLQGERVEVGVAEVVAAIHVGAAEGFGDDVDLRGAAVGSRRRQGLDDGREVVRRERMLRISTRTMPPEEGGGAVMMS